jgi:hypothetical protein
MKLLQLLENTQQFPDTKEEIERILNKYKIANYTINGDMSVDVDGDVNLYLMGLISLPVKFGKVSGAFKCYGNNLTSLRGAPREVGGYFDCRFNNDLTSLDGIGNVHGQIITS